MPENDPILTPGEPPIQEEDTARLVIRKSTRPQGFRAQADAGPEATRAALPAKPSAPAPVGDSDPSKRATLPARPMRPRTHPRPATGDATAAGAAARATVPDASNRPTDPSRPTLRERVARRFPTLAGAAKKEARPAAPPPMRPAPGAGGSPRAAPPARPSPRPAASEPPPQIIYPAGRRGAPPPPPRRGRKNTSSPYNPRPVYPAGGRGASCFNTGLGCLARAAFAGLFVLLAVALCGVSLAFVQYVRIARDLPDIDNLSSHTSQFETTRILDRQGNTLYELVDPSAGRRTYVPLERISPYMVAAIVATEDRGFYSHPGFDVFAILRAFVQNAQSGETVSGASTITQQLARNLLFTPEERSAQTYERKMREAILASEITRRYSKNEILEMYLNEIYFGNLAYGVEAAAETYFKTTSDKLTLGQASFLAGLPQAPAVYDVYTNPDAALSRHRDVLSLMYEASREQDCIFVSNSPQNVCVDAVSTVNAANEIKTFNFPPPVIQIRYPHWVMYVRSLLEAQYDPQTIYRLGYTVTTSLDPALQEFAQAAVAEQVAGMAAQNAKNGALVAIRPGTGEILAMVGSPDFYNDAIAGQVNMAISPRQPGSSFKPLTYLAAFEKGWTPATLIWDVPSEFPPSGRADDTRPPYVPANYDSRFHGPVTVRTALANSYNIPAVKALQFVGIYDDPNQPGEDGVIALARRMGIGTLTSPDYGLSLTLGGGEVTLLDMTSAYATLANNGRRMPPAAILKITDNAGNVVYEYKPNGGEQAIRSEHAFLMNSILADTQARLPAFGANSPLQLAFPAAVKTGTTNDFRDNWTLGYNPDLAVGVWIGNADYSVMQNTTGLSGAAPVWNRVMSEAVPRLTNNSPTQFAMPAGIVETVICEVSGTIPSQWCPRQRSEFFAVDQPPLPADQDLWQKIYIDTWTGLRASQACADFVDEKFVVNVQDQFARRWLRRDPEGQAWAQSMGFERPIVFAPERECRPDDPRPTLLIAFPKDGETIQDVQLNVYALIDSTQEFDFWHLDAGRGEKPVEWVNLAQGANRISQPEIIATWDVRDLPPGEVMTLRLVLEGKEGAYAIRSVRVLMMVPTPTPTVTPQPTETPQPSATPQPTATPTLPPPPPTAPPPPTETPTATIEPSAYPARFPKATSSP